LAAEAWVYQPEDLRQQHALQIGNKGDRNDPATWLALAAGWSGGSRMVGDKPVPLEPSMTAQATRVAILISAGKIGGAERTRRLRGCIAEAIKLAEHGLG
jgi:hypothetical protein